MTQIPILNGVYVDGTPDFRTRLPRNYVPVPKATGISEGYLRPSDGLVTFGTGPGVDRGGIEWQGLCYRVMGTKFVLVSVDGSVLTIGDVGTGGQCSFAYSFDRLAVTSGGRLYYYDGIALQQVTDPDLGFALTVIWVDGYFMTTDGEFLVVTELNDPFAVDPLKYGSSEVDPDPVVALLKLRNEVYAVNRNTIEIFNNVGSTGFPFQRIEGAQITRGSIGTHSCCVFNEGIAFLGSGNNEPPSVWFARSGVAIKIANREIEDILLGYTEAQLRDVVLEPRADRVNNMLLLHLPDQTLVYDVNASEDLQLAIWFTLDSGSDAIAQYRAKNWVWVYDRWLFGDPTTSNVGTTTRTRSDHYGQDVRWEINTLVLYNASRGAIVHEIELAALPGYAATGDNPVVSVASSDDGVTFTPDRSISAGTRGQTQKRIAWRRLGHMRNYRIQRFRGMSDCHLPLARLEAQLEPMNA